MPYFCPYNFCFMIVWQLMAWLWWAGWLPSQPLPISQVSQTNQARQDAGFAYKAGQYQRALSLYTYLDEVSNAPDYIVQLNLGHTYFQLRQYSKAAQKYTRLQQADLPELRSVAATQLGVIACIRRDSSAALSLFRQALLIDFTNEPARRNFELVKRYYTPKPTKSRQMATQQTATQSAPATGRVEQSTRQDELLRRFRQLNMTEEQALQLLNAMQNDDLPYSLTRSARQPSAKQKIEKQNENRW